MGFVVVYNHRRDDLLFFGIAGSAEGYHLVCISLAPKEIMASSWYLLQSYVCMYVCMMISFDINKSQSIVWFVTLTSNPVFQIISERVHYWVSEALSWSNDAWKLLSHSQQWLWCNEKLVYIYIRSMARACNSNLIDIWSYTNILIDVWWVINRFIEQILFCWFDSF